MIIEWIKLGLSVLSLLVSVGMFIYIRIDRRDRATTKSIEDLKGYVNAKLDDKCTRITRLEEVVKNTPNHKDLGKIYDEIRKQSDAISDVDKTVSKLVGAFEPLEKLVVRMDTFLRDHQ
jgi:hypothetical protein